MKKPLDRERAARIRAARLATTYDQALEEYLDPEIYEVPDGDSSEVLPIRQLVACKACGYKGHPYEGQACAECDGYFRIATGGFYRRAAS